MLELNRDQREVLIGALPDVANVTVGALVFGQVLSDRAFSFGLALLGGALWVLFVGVAVVLARK